MGVLNRGNKGKKTITGDRALVSLQYLGSDFPTIIYVSHITVCPLIEYFKIDPLICKMVGDFY